MNKILYISISFLFLNSTLFGLVTGDIAFTAFNADGEDDFAIVALVDIPANTNIYFTDKEPNSDGSGFTDAYEGTLKWVTGDSIINEGSIVIFTDVDADGNLYFGASIGILTDASFDAGFNLAADGDALYAIEGSDDGDVLTILEWLAGIQNESGNEGDNFNQTGLTKGSTFIEFYTSGHPDGGYYSGNREGQSPFSSYLSFLGDNSNWSIESSNGELILPISTTAFSLGVTITGNSGFRMMSSPVPGAIYGDLLDELWTGGATGADNTNVSYANMWTYNGSSWTALTDITASGNSLTAGQGFLVYVFEDCNADGDTDDAEDLPVTLSVSGSENTGNATLGSIADGTCGLAGNPYASTIDWDLITKTNVTTSCYVWDDATSAYKEWNGSSGGLTDGLIAPYQGFWVEASGGVGSITIEEADKSGTAGTFYRIDRDDTGSIVFDISTENHFTKTYISFMDNGEPTLDNSDALKLLPLSATNRLVGMTYVDDTSLSINNLPFTEEGSIELPFDIMSLTVDENYNFITEEIVANLTWNLDNLPETIVGLTLTHNTTNEVTNLLTNSDLSFNTVSKGSFSSYGDESVGIYPKVEESLFTLTVYYTLLGTEDNIPITFGINSVYPNPFNPETVIKYSIENQSEVSLQIFNINGQLVETLLHQNQESGYHEVIWDATNYSSGVYIARLTSGDSIQNQKLTLLK